MEILYKDIRYAIRSLLRKPGFVAIAVITLGLGIGANTAMFTVVNAVLLRPLSFPEPEQLVRLDGVNPRHGITGSNMSIPDILDWQKQSQSFESITGYLGGGVLLTSGDETERVRAAGVSDDFFRMFRTNAMLGRVIGPDDTPEGREPVVVLSHGLWQRRFGSDPNIIGTKVMMSGESTTIVGVMPPGFDYPAQSEAWAPFALDPKDQPRDNRFVNVTARLKPGVTIDQAQAELNIISQRLAQSYTETNTDWGVKLTNLRDSLVDNLRTSLFILLGAVALVLLIACANVANLLLARAAFRQKEIAVRTALGASRLRIVRQLLTESLLLSIVSGIIGLLLSIWLTRLLIAINPPNSPRFDEIGFDTNVFLFTLAVTILTAFLFGLAPALQLSRPAMNETLKEGGRQGSFARNRTGSVLMVTEIAFSFMLLVGAGLLIKSFVRLSEIDPGFNPDNVLTMRMTLPSGKYQQGEPRAQIYNQILESVKSTPGVESAGATLSLPLRGDTYQVGRSVIREGRPETPSESTNAMFVAVTPDYFRTLQIPLKSGRLFADTDNFQSPKVIIINERMARELWPGENVIGRNIKVWRDEKFPREIVGVVGDVKPSLDEESPTQMYVPYAQDGTWGSLSLAVRTNGEPTALSGAVRNAVRSVEKGVPLYNLKTMDDVVATSAAPRRTPMLLFTAFAGVAMLLAMLGIYGITTYYVTQRTHEIGIRMALGAQLRDVLRLVLSRGMLLAVVGVGVGLVGAFLLTRYLTTMLFGVQPIDPLTFAAVSVVLIAVALIACYIPARRATKVDPVIALRYE
ncbi:MAG TPA: ABC transporter permease [Pyrinomonadaceae bacterium]|nr:ABC transporter permease [Pyrinomonadaceae bacterium]